MSNPFVAGPRADPAPEDVDGDTRELAQQLLWIIEKDRRRYDILQDYHDGRHPDPYMPDSATAEYRGLAKRAVSNCVPLIVSTPAQALYIDSFRSGDQSAEATQDEHNTPAWKHWQASGMDARQHAVYRGAFIYGHAFVVTETERDGEVRSRGLSAKKTAALYDDPANDLVPVAALTIHRKERTVISGGKSDVVWGTAYMWDENYKYTVRFDGYVLKTIVREGLHGASSCPVTRFACMVDLDGRTTGVVEPIIPLQDRINQIMFDLLVASTYGSFKVRTVTGMAPEVEMEPVYAADGSVESYQPKLDDEGQPVPKATQINVSRFLFAEDPDTKFGQLDETPLGGYIQAIDMSVKQLSSFTQTPPHYLLGELVNISGDALKFSETTLTRKVQEYQSIFGESWERVFRVAAEIKGDTSAATDYAAEVIWRDMDNASMSQTADALGKLAQQLQIPPKGLWSKIPGTTQTELAEWDRLSEEQDSQLQMANALNRATGVRPGQPVNQQPQGVVNGNTTSGGQAA